MAKRDTEKRNGNLAIFIDWDNIRISLEKNYKSVPTNSIIGKAIVEDIAREYGKVLTTRAYCDWTRNIGTQQAPKELDRQQIECVQVAATLSGKDRTDPRITLDAVETLFTRQDIDIFLLVAGDGDYKDLIRRIKGRGKEVGVCAVSATVNRDLISEADFFIPIERHLDLESETPWSSLISELYRFEDWATKKGAFVGLKYFAKVVSGAKIGCPDEIPEKIKLINEAKHQGVITIQQIPNPKDPSHPPTSAIALNRENLIVKEVISKIKGT